MTALGVLCCFALFVCLTLLASFFLPSHLSFKNMYIYMYIFGSVLCCFALFVCLCTCSSMDYLFLSHRYFSVFPYLFAACMIHVHVHVYMYIQECESKYMYVHYTCSQGWASRCPLLYTSTFVCLGYGWVGYVHVQYLPFLLSKS